MMIKSQLDSGKFDRLKSVGTRPSNIITYICKLNSKLWIKAEN